jgi:hypothetical protein
MRSFFLTALVTLGNLTSLIAPAAQAQTATLQDCSATVIAVRNELERGRDLEVVLVETRDLTQSYADYPVGRPLSYYFRIDGTAADDVMLSPRFLTTLSTQIINRCPSAGSVDFGVNRTDWSKTYGYMGEGRVEAFRCVEPDRNRGDRQLAWGYDICCI